MYLWPKIDDSRIPNIARLASCSEDDVKLILFPRVKMLYQDDIERLNSASDADIADFVSVHDLEIERAIENSRPQPKPGVSSLY
jgi:hypothetical protein